MFRMSSMKRLILSLTALASSAFAELPQMSDKTEWLGYFVGWEDKKFDFGIGADGEVALMVKKSGKRVSHRDISIRYVIEEEIKGKWVRRQFTKDGLSSEQEKGIDPKKPVVVSSTVTGDTKVEWTHVLSRGTVSVLPKLIEKKTENKIRVGMEFSLPRLHRFDEKPDKKELKSKAGDDHLRGIRLKDGKKIRIKFDDLEDDVSSEEFLQDGASEVEVKSKGISDLKFIVENGDEKMGRIDIVTKGPLYNSFKVLWMADMEKLGDKKNFVSFSLE